MRISEKTVFLALGFGGLALSVGPSISLVLAGKALTTAKIVDALIGVFFSAVAIVWAITRAPKKDDGRQSGMGGGSGGGTTGSQGLHTGGGRETDKAGSSSASGGAAPARAAEPLSAAPASISHGASSSPRPTTPKTPTKPSAGSKSASQAQSSLQVPDPNFITPPPANRVAPQTPFLSGPCTPNWTPSPAGGGEAPSFSAVELSPGAAPSPISSPQTLTGTPHKKRNSSQGPGSLSISPATPLSATSLSESTTAPRTPKLSVQIPNAETAGSADLAAPTLTPAGAAAPKAPDAPLPPSPPAAAAAAAAQSRSGSDGKGLRTLVKEQKGNLRKPDLQAKASPPSATGGFAQLLLQPQKNQVQALRAHLNNRRSRVADSPSSGAPGSSWNNRGSLTAQQVMNLPDQRLRADEDTPPGSPR